MTRIPDSWELSSYLAGELDWLDSHRRPDRERNYENPGLADVVDIEKGKALQDQRRSEPAPAYDWAEPEHVEPYDPSEYPDRDFYNQDDLDHLEEHEFYPTDSGTWERPFTDVNGETMPGHHIITYHPGNRLSSGKLAPWVLTSHPDEVGAPYGSLRGSRGAMAAANAERDQTRQQYGSARDGWED